MTTEKYYVIRCYGSFNELYKLCKRTKCTYYKNKMHNSYGVHHYREAWLTPEQFTFFNLLLNGNQDLTEFMIRAYGPPDINDSHVDMLFDETFGTIY